MSAAINVHIELPKGQRMADIDGIRHDLRVCRDCCQKYLALLSKGMKGENDHFLSEVLVTTAFTKYGRCFKGGVRIKTTKEILDQLTDEDLEVHQVLVDIRDKHVSHSVNEFERSQVSVWLRHESPEREVTNVSIGTTYISAPDAAVFSSWIVLIDKIDKWLHQEFQAESQRLAQLVKDRFTLDELYDKIGKGKRHEVKCKDIPKTRKGV